MSVLQSVARGMDHHRNGRIAQAEAEYRDALAHDPKNPDALHLLGTIVAGKGNPGEGIKLIEGALAIMPKSPEAHFNLANIYAGLYRFAEAEPHFRTAFTLNPANAEAANGTGGAALRLGKYREAEVWLKKALALDPQCIGALTNMGTLMDAVGRFSETIAYYDRAIALAPQTPEPRQFRALALLARGSFEDGWKEFDWRFTYSPAFHGRFPYPRWRGEPLTGRKILVWTEQGLGDEILAASMVPDLVRASAHVVLIASERLCRLFAQSFPTIDVVAANRVSDHTEVFENVTFQASMSDLGQCLRPSFSAFPGTSGYLVADPALASSLRGKYLAGAPEHLLVGLSWRSKARDGGAEKTIPLTEWARVLRTPGVRFVNLQYGDTDAEVAAAERSLGVKIFVDRNIDPRGEMSAVAAQVAAMDFVATVSNTAAHVAGALGKEMAVLIPSNSGRLWYWFLGRDDCPWYPRARLNRQSASGWSEAMDKVAGEIESRLSARTSP